MNTASKDLDYRSTIRAAALTFLERHQGEHLGDQGQFIERTANHLVDSFQADKPLAIRLTCEAMSDLYEINVRQRLDLHASESHAVVITDPVRGCTWSVPVHLIYEHLIAAGRATRITSAT
jgi:environmental stress-induced protein Ves